MPEPDIEEIKAHLRESIKNYKKPLRGKLALLALLKKEVLDFREKGASAEYIAEKLKEKNFSVSKDTILKFIRQERQVKGIGRTTKPKASEAA
jgi:IS30 family transposase